MLIACAPQVPRISTHDFLGRQIDAAVHRFENVGSDLWKIGSGLSSRFRLINRLILFATGKCEGQTGGKANSDPGETEKIAFGLEERLHRGIIDMSLVNRKAREF